MKRVPASEATRKRREEVFSGEHIDLSRIVRAATRLMIRCVRSASSLDCLEGLQIQAPAGRWRSPVDTTMPMK